MKHTMYIVDAFTDTLFKGNPAAVIVLEEWLSDELMQAIAQENNLSETAYLVADEQGRYHIRWFSPISEIDFCGHASLASAYVLLNKYKQSAPLRMHAKAVSEFSMEQLENGRIEMNFPVRPAEPISEIPTQLIAGLSLAPKEVWRNQQAYMVVYDNEDDVRKVVTDDAQLKQLHPYDVVVTAAGSETDCVSRYFWPANGGTEDPVTGSIHACLFPYWGERLGKTELIALQASSRTGVLYGRLEGDRVYISGDCVLYAVGEIHLTDA